MRTSYLFPVLTTVICSTAVAGQVFGQGVLLSKSTASLALSKGCELNSAKISVDDMNLALRNPSPLTSVDCSTCTLTHTTNIVWCRDLPGGCFDLIPWHTNFEFEKQIKYYSCPGNVTGIKCGTWVGSGCCGSDDSSEPQCPSGNGLATCETPGAG